MKPLLACLLLALALPAGAETLRIDGEVYARSSAQIMPPTAEGMWQFNITRLAPDGATLAKGAVAVAFDASPVRIGNATCRGRVGQYVEVTGAAVSLKKKKHATT